MVVAQRGRSSCEYDVWSSRVRRVPRAASTRSAPRKASAAEANDTASAHPNTRLATSLVVISDVLFSYRYTVKNIRKFTTIHWKVCFRLAVVNLQQNVVTFSTSP